MVALAKGAQLFDDLGALTRPVGTSPEAQRYFDQGLRLAYGFNHDEATRSFARAAELDTGCAACFWGVAWTLGPNYNVPMLPDRAQAAWDAANACLDTHGGYGFAVEFDVERKFRETRLYSVAPINNNLVLAYVGQHVLGMPRSY